MHKYVFAIHSSFSDRLPSSEVNVLGHSTSQSGSIPLCLHRVYLVSVLVIYKSQHSQSCDLCIRMHGAHFVSRNILLDFDAHCNIHKGKELIKVQF